jgi:hypothetical protein
MHVGQTILKRDADPVVPHPHRLADMAQFGHGTQHPAGNKLATKALGRGNSRNRGVVRACQALLDVPLSGGRPNGLRP